MRIDIQISPNRCIPIVENPSNRCCCAVDFSLAHFSMFSVWLLLFAVRTDRYCLFATVYYFYRCRRLVCICCCCCCWVIFGIGKDFCVAASRAMIVARLKSSPVVTLGCYILMEIDHTLAVGSMALFPGRLKTDNFFWNPMPHRNLTPQSRRQVLQARGVSTHDVRGNTFGCVYSKLTSHFTDTRIRVSQNWTLLENLETSTLNGTQ